MTIAIAEADRVLEARRDDEMEEARALQQAMVPVEPLLYGEIEIASRFRPVTQVGGDFLDYFLLSDRTLGLYLGDVTGKGLPAALYAALALGTLRGITKTSAAPADVLDLLNRRLRTRIMPRRYCATQYAVFDPATRVLRYANAGLPGPLFISKSGCRELREGGLPSAMFDDSRYDSHSVQLHPGDAVLFMTDGLTEAVNSGDDDFGMERLLEACDRNCPASAAVLLQKIFEAVDDFAGGHPQFDDMAAAVLKLSG